jgi:hypothetical protein
LLDLFFVLPLIYVAVIVILLLRKEFAGVGESVAFFILAVATAVWAILQSRSSTAGIGFLGLPLIGALAGFLGLAFGRWRTSRELSRQIVAWGALAGVVLLILFTLREGAKTREKNAVRDVVASEHAAEIARDRAMIAAAVSENPTGQRAYIDSSIRARMNDRAFLIAALENDSVSPEILDTLARSSDLGIVLQAVRNHNTNAETLTRVYRTSTYPYYYYQALAEHPHTPPDILREIYRKPEPIGSLEIWFAKNPALPRDLLDEIATKTKEPNAIVAMLGNSALDCDLIGKLETSLRSIYPDSVQSDYIMRDLKQRRTQLCGTAAISFLANRLNSVCSSSPLSPSLNT